MTATGHAVIGTVIAAALPNPVLAIPLALLSHVGADLFPHWDLGTHRKEKSRNKLFLQSAFDVLFGFLVSFLIIHFFFPKTNLIYAFIIIIAAQFFDWASAPYMVLGIQKPSIFAAFYKFQKLFDNKLDMPWGFVGQVAALIALVVLVNKFI